MQVEMVPGETGGASVRTQILRANTDDPRFTSDAEPEVEQDGKWTTTTVVAAVETLDSVAGVASTVGLPYLVFDAVVTWVFGALLWLVENLLGIWRR